MFFILFITFILVLVSAIHRITKSQDWSSISCLVGAIAYNVIVMMGILRMYGFLLAVKDLMIERVLSDVGNGIRGMNGTSTVITICCIAAAFFNLIVSWSIYKSSRNGHGWTWVGVTLSTFLLALFGASIAISQIGIKDIGSVLFDLCCGLMALVAYALGLTYKEFCVLGNIYLQTIILVASSGFILKIVIVKFRERVSFRRILALILSLGYFALFIFACSLICIHYWMPLESAFNLCVQELIKIGNTYDIGYIGANFAIFVFGWLFVLLLNVALAIIAEREL